jgi:uncharacterized protein (DUF736 family)
MAKDPSEVGAIWAKENERGQYFSISLDLNALLQLTGGVMSGTLDLKAFPITFEKTNPKAPDYRVKYYPQTRKSAPARASAPQRPGVLDNELDDGLDDPPF